MPSYAIVLDDGTHGPFFASIEEAAEWARSSLRQSEPSASYPLAVRQDDVTTISGEVVIARTGTARRLPEG